jgi:Lon protease-like protein
MSNSVAVQFKQRFPVFPLPETMLLPHAIMPLSIFEPRYRQMTDRALDGSGQIAIATLVGPHGQRDADGSLPLRDAVCLGQIVQHEKAMHGYNILVYGLCRALILEMYEPEGDQLYRTAKLQQLEITDEEVNDVYRHELRKLLDRPNLQRLEHLDSIVQWIDEPELSTLALFELLGCSLFDDSELRYDLLAEPSSEVRTLRVLSELQRLDRLLKMTDKQSQDQWENGISWN